MSKQLGQEGRDCSEVAVGANCDDVGDFAPQPCFSTKSQGQSINMVMGCHGQNVSQSLSRSVNFCIKGLQGLLAHAGRDTILLSLLQLHSMHCPKQARHHRVPETSKPPPRRGPDIAREMQQYVYGGHKYIQILSRSRLKTELWFSFKQFQTVRFQHGKNNV